MPMTIGFTERVLKSELGTSRLEVALTSADAATAAAAAAARLNRLRSAKE